MDGGVISGSAIASVFTATLRISQVVYELKAVGEQTRDLLETTKHIDESSGAVRRIRRQKSNLLNKTEKSWIDGVLKNTDLAVGAVAKLIEPARVDMETRSGKTKDIKLWHRTLFVLKDSPKVNVNLMRLCVATQGLNAAMIILCNREGYGEANLAVPLSGGTIRRRASSPGGQAPPPYDYRDFLNRRRVSTGDKKKKLQPKASKVSFVVGDDDDDDATLVSEEPEEREDPLQVRRRFIEPEDINDPEGRGIKEVHPNPQLQKETVDMVKLVIPTTIDQTPACVPDPMTPPSGVEWSDEALRNWRIRLEDSNRLLRHEQSMYQLKAERTNSLNPTGLGISTPHPTGQNFLGRTISLSGRPTFNEEFSQPPRPTSSQSTYRDPPPAGSQYSWRNPPPAGQNLWSNFTPSESGVPPPVPPRPSAWTVPPPSRPPENPASRIKLPYPDSPQLRVQSQTPPAQPLHAGALPYGASPTQLSYPTSAFASQQDVSPPYQSGQFFPSSFSTGPTQHSPLTHFNSAPAVPTVSQVASNDFSTYRTHVAPAQQTPFQLSLPPQASDSPSDLQPVYSHLSKNYSIPNPSPEMVPDSRRRFRFIPRVGGSQPQSPGAAAPEFTGHERDYSISSDAASVHSYEPFDPHASKPLPSVPRDSVGSIASMSSLSLVSMNTIEPSAFEYAAVTTEDGSDGETLRRSRTVSGSGSDGGDGTGMPSSRGRVGLEFRMSLVDEAGQGPRGRPR